MAFRFLRSEKEESEQQAVANSNPNEDIEKRFVSRIRDHIQTAETSKTTAVGDEEFSVEENWEDEYKVYKGGGLQWCTNFAYRTKRSRRNRANSEDNFVFNAVQIQVANITSNTPEVSIDGTRKKHEEHARKVTYISRFNDERNYFPKLWREWVHDFCAYGPTIAKVDWDQDWIGGVGPDRWVGDVRLIRVDKKDFFPDPAIIDLENKIQDCSYIVQRYRKKLSYIRKKWEDTGKVITEESNTDEYQNEGSDPEMAYVYEYWHRGFPEFMPPERAKELKERAFQQEEQGDTYKAKDLYDAAKGNLDGIHVAYYCNNILLDYIPYVYDDALYPFVFTTRYKDENAQWGWGEIRNIKIPQVLHNKADEIEIEAMSRQGLGGMFYNKGALTRKQLETLLRDSAKGGMFFEVEQVAQLKEREGVSVPASIDNYKEHKERMIQTISQVTPIQQGLAPNSNMPYKAIAELGSRTDVRMKQAAAQLEFFLRQINKLRINRFAQFYTEERYYRIKDANGEVIDGTFKNDELFDVWTRETVNEKQIDPMTGQEIEVPVDKQEFFVPEFDIKLDIINTKPDDRNYYTNVGFTMFDRGLMTGEDLWRTIEDGKFPPIDDILQHLQAQDVMKQIQATLQEMPPQAQQMIIQMVQQTLQEAVAKSQMPPEQQMMQQQQMLEGQEQQAPEAEQYSPDANYSGAINGGMSYENKVDQPIRGY